MNRTKRFIGLIVAFSLVAYLAIGYADVASAGRVAVCAPAQAVPAVCQPAQPVLPPPPVCQPAQPAPVVCAPAAQVVLHNHLADVAHHLHAILAQHHKVHYVVVAQAAPLPAVCQPAKIVPLPPVCQPVLPAPAVCQPALPPPAACEPAKQVGPLHHLLHHHLVYTYAAEQPVVAPTIAPPAPALAPAPSAPKAPAPPVKGV